MSILGVTVQDVNGDEVPDAKVMIKDLGSQSPNGLEETLIPGRLGIPTRHVFNLGSLPKFSIDLKAQNFFDTSLTLTQAPDGDWLEVNARSPIFGLFSFEAAPGLHPNLQLTATRLRLAPRVNPPEPRDQGPGVVDDPGGIWVDRDKKLVRLSHERVDRFPVLLERKILKNADRDDWDRFNWTGTDVDPAQPLGGSWFDWVEYGDPQGFRMLVALWVLNRAGARTDGKVDILFFFCPRTSIDAFAPENVFPYKRKRDPDGIVQPYSFLAYRYLGLRSPAGSDLALAYQAMATKRALVFAMPINAFGFWGPLLSQEGLCRLAKEIALFIGDNTRNTLPPSVKSFVGSRQVHNRIAVSGYSAGAQDAIRLFDNQSIANLITNFEKGDKTDQAFAKRIASMKARLWSSPSSEFERAWKEFYSIDGFFGSNKVFPDQFGAWFEKSPDRMLRVYATPGRMEDPMKVATSQLARILKDVESEDVTRSSDSSFRALAWHRKDGRATLAWFSMNYMQLKSVPFMPVDDDHHTIPRVVLSHAVSQSGFLQM